jgi:Nif-specific regulatory protein
LIGQTVKLHRVVTRDRDRLIEESHRLQKQITKLQPAPMSKAKMSGIIGESPQIRAVMDKIAIVARSNSTLLLRGESGTGKELFARALHELSPRASKAFVKVNCAALAESVLESELFGHEKGAFTGAIATRKGRFELADGGTLFLDEIAEISLSFQAKLLRVLQGGEFERVGGTKTLKADVRLIAATNKNLEEAVRKGEFRADLYYRISVVPMLLPPLRERTSDIPLLAAHFLEQFNQQNGRELTFSKEAVQVLKSCYFPGNVRELENCVQRTATFTVGNAIVASDFACGQDQCLSATLWKGKSHETVTTTGVGGLGPLPAGDGAAERHTRARHAEESETVVAQAAPAAADSDDSNEHARLLDAMEKSGWVQAKAARIMGLTPRQIGYALRKHGIEIKKF